MRLPLSVLVPLVPSALHPYMRDSRFYSSRSDAITVQADGSRKQSENVDECFRKLYDMIAEIGRGAIPGATSETQKARVQQMYAYRASYMSNLSRLQSPVLTCCLWISRQNAGDQRRQREKKMQSARKSSRRGSAHPDY